MPSLDYLARAKQTPYPLAQKLLNIMATKKTNLALSIDVTKYSDLITFAEKLGDEICLLKTHIDILEDFENTTPHIFPRELLQIAQEKNFLILEDRKFADIGNTVKHQYQGGLYKIADWADFVTVHSLPGPGIIQGLKAGIPSSLQSQRGGFLLAQMSSEKNLLQKDYTQQTIEMAKQFPEFVLGFIAQERLLDNPDFIYLTPGVNLSDKGDGLGQQYHTPQSVIAEKKSDIMIVGRGIISAANPLETARLFKEQGWQAYLSR